MTPYYSESGIEIYHGKAEDVLPALAENRFDTCITDPPYHLTTNKKGGTGEASLNPNSPAGRSRIGTGFMGKAWDGGDVAFRPETWAAVLRVCKPGAILLAFGGTRTFHRLTCAIEDGGWEIRDCMSWLYGSGFPKSLDISKAIDKAAGAERKVVGERPWTNAKMDAGQGVSGLRQAGSFAGEYESARLSVPITAPATDSARLWSGWGTSLKPAWEPVIVAMKPLDGTYAQNALRHGVAGLNIDGGRIGTDNTMRPMGKLTSKGLPGGGFSAPERLGNRAIVGDSGSTSGRFPANVVLDEAAAEQLDAMSGESRSDARPRPSPAQRENTEAWRFNNHSRTGYEDAGGASRFYYTAKASRSDRGHGNTHPTVKPTDLLKYLCTLTATPTGGEIIDPFGGSMTTLVAAREAHRPAVAIEMLEDHCRIGIDRLRQGVLFPPETEAVA